MIQPCSNTNTHSHSHSTSAVNNNNAVSSQFLSFSLGIWQTFSMMTHWLFLYVTLCVNCVYVCLNVRAVYSRLYEKDWLWRRTWRFHHRQLFSYMRLNMNDFRCCLPFLTLLSFFYPWQLLSFLLPAPCRRKETREETRGKGTSCFSVALRGDRGRSKEKQGVGAPLGLWGLLSGAERTGRGRERRKGERRWCGNREE